MKINIKKRSCSLKLKGQLHRYCEIAEVNLQSWNISNNLKIINIHKHNITELYQIQINRRTNILRQIFVK